MAHYGYDDDSNSELLERDEELPDTAIVKHYYAPNIYSSNDKLGELYRKLHKEFSVDSVVKHSTWNNYITVTGYEPLFNAKKILKKIKKMDSQAKLE